jgi:putative FmdB family regulatory protein
MPIYDFKCRKCGHRFDQLVKVDGTADCPACGAKKAERIATFTARVSTVRTRTRAMTEARGVASAQKKEKDHAHAEYLRKEMKDHGG